MSAETELKIKIKKKKDTMGNYPAFRYSLPYIEHGLDLLKERTVLSLLKERSQHCNVLSVTMEDLDRMTTRVDLFEKRYIKNDKMSIHLLENINKYPDHLRIDCEGTLVYVGRFPIETQVYTHGGVVTWPSTELPSPPSSK